MTKEITFRHPGILPSFAVHLIRRNPFLECELGLISRADLLAWPSDRPLNDDIRVQLCRSFLRRYKNTSISLNLVVNIPISPNWRSVLTEEEKKWFTSFIEQNMEGFSKLTLEQIASGLKKQTKKILIALARLEALNWSERPFDVFSPKTHEMTTAEIDMNFKKDVLNCLDSPWVANLKGGDLRFSALSKESFRNSLRSEMEKVNIDLKVLALARNLLNAHRATWSEELRNIAAHLSRSVPSMSTPNASLLKVREDIFCFRFSGSEGMTQIALAKRLGIAWKAVQTLLASMLETLEGTPVETPALKRLLDEADCMELEKIQDADEKLRLILGPDSELEGATKFARFIGLDHPFLLRQKYNEKSMPAWASKALSLAKRDCDDIGCTSLIRIAGLLVCKDLIPEQFINLQAFFEGCDGFRYVEEKSGWFTFTDSDSGSAAKILRKLMSVCNSKTDITSYIVALHRSHRPAYTSNIFLAPVPPAHILNKLISSWTWVESIGNDKFRSKMKLNRAHELTDVELQIYKLICSRGGVMTRKEIFADPTVRQSTADHLISEVVSSSPILTKLMDGKYGIVGLFGQSPAIVVQENNQQVTAL